MRHPVPVQVRVEDVPIMFSLMSESIDRTRDVDCEEKSVARSILRSQDGILNGAWRPPSMVTSQGRSTGTIRIGCLAPLVLFILGGLVGQGVMGASGVPWGAG